MYRAQNGWTKDLMKKCIREKNNGTRSANAFGGLYRTSEGNACAAGCFIPDDLYDPAFEQHIIDNLMNGFASVRNVMPLDARGMFQLQRRDVLCDWIDANVEDSP